MSEEIKTIKIRIDTFDNEEGEITFNASIEDVGDKRTEDINGHTDIRQLFTDIRMLLFNDFEIEKTNIGSAFTSGANNG